MFQCVNKPVFLWLYFCCSLIKLGGWTVEVNWSLLCFLFDITGATRSHWAFTPSYMWNSKYSLDTEWAIWIGGIGYLHLNILSCLIDILVAERWWGCVRPIHFPRISVGFIVYLLVWEIEKEEQTFFFLNDCPPVKFILQTVGLNKKNSVG